MLSECHGLHWVGEARCLFDERGEHADQWSARQSDQLAGAVLLQVPSVHSRTSEIGVRVRSRIADLQAEAGHGGRPRQASQRVDASHWVELSTALSQLVRSGYVTEVQHLVSQVVGRAEIAVAEQLANQDGEPDLHLVQAMLQDAHAQEHMQAASRLADRVEPRLYRVVFTDPAEAAPRRGTSSA